MQGILRQAAALKAMPILKHEPTTPTRTPPSIPKESKPSTSLLKEKQDLDPVSLKETPHHEEIHEQQDTDDFDAQEKAQEDFLFEDFSEDIRRLELVNL